MLKENDGSELVEVFDETITQYGLSAGLRFLNERTEHRFTGVYRFDPEHGMRNLRLFDRRNPDLEVGGDVPLRESYCSIVVSRGRPFCATDARTDERLEEHPSRETTISYCGVPLRSPDAESPLGTLCHFDLVPRSIAADEIEVMEGFVPRLVEHLREEGLLPAAAEASP